jgi:uncharacterized protein YggE
MEDDTQKVPKPKKSQGKKIVLTLSWKVLAIVLGIALVGLTFYTKPWEGVSDNMRTITINGEATIKRAPDSFVFNPSYEATSQEEITAKTNEVVAKVKELGLGDAGIQSQVSNYEKYDSTGSATGEMTYTAFLTLSVEDKELAQKIQDYLLTTGSTGQITPTSGFTKETQKALRDEATTLAVQDARKRADSTAENLDAKVVKVITVTEPDQTDGGVYPLYSSLESVSKDGSGLPINSGESEFNYSVTVEFQIR